MAEAKPSSSYRFVKTIRHGFPDNPSCVAYDCVQELVAFGSQNGGVVVLGRPGLETRFEAPSGVLQIQFSINKGIIVVYCSNHTCYFWSIQTSTPQLLGEFKLPSKETSVVLYWPYNSNTVYVGTNNGNVLFIVFEQTVISGTMVNTSILICEETVYWNKVTVPSQGFRRDHPGEVKSIEEHPSEPDKILIAYARGLCVVWNLKNKEVEHRQQHEELECASWYGVNGKMYVFCTCEGQITRVQLKKKEEKILYQCPGVGSITNLQSCTVRQDKWLLFVQCTLIDKICQTNIIVLGEKARITSLSFDQSIVDFVCIPLTPFKSEKQISKALVVLQTKKLDVFDMTYDLSSQRPLPFHIPFSFDLLSSSIAVLHNGGCCLSQTTVDKLMVFKSKIRCDRKNDQNYSSKKWPFEGGEAWKKESRADTSPVLLVTSHANKGDSITLWLYYSDILENLFTIETAKLFPLNYSCPSKQSSITDVSSSTEEPEAEVQRKPGAGASGPKDQLDVKFLIVNMKEETIVFVNYRGNVLIYNFGQLQPDHEQPTSTEIVLNEVEEVDSPTTQDKRNQLPWRFWATNDTPQINLLHHVCCVVDWEDNIQVVPIESAVYNDEIKMLLLGTHIAMVLVDLKNKGKIVIDTLKTLKSLGLSNITSCERRMVVESKKKFGILKRFSGKKSKSKPLLSPSHDSTPFCSSIVDIVFFITNVKEQPSLTIWMGTVSGELAVYKVIRNPSNDQELQVKSTGILLQQKEAINDMIFFTENFQKIHSNIPWHCLLQESLQSNASSIADSGDSVILNYVVVQSKNKLKCFGFPAKKIAPISKYKDTKNEIMKSTFTRLKDSPYLLTILSHGELLISSLPDLIPITSVSVTNDIAMSELKSLTFNETGHGMYVSKEFEIQRVNIGVSSCDGNDETDGPSSVNIYPSTFVPHSDPLIPKSTLRNTSDRSSWFTPHRPRGARNFSKSVPLNYKSNVVDTPKQFETRKPNPGPSSTFDRTAWALDERGKRLNKTVETTNRLLQMAEVYADNASKRR